MSFSVVGCIDRGWHRVKLARLRLKMLIVRILKCNRCISAIINCEQILKVEAGFFRKVVILWMRGLVHRKGQSTTGRRREI